MNKYVLMLAAAGLIAAAPAYYAFQAQAEEAPAAEAAVGLGIVIAMFKNKETMNINEIDLMKW